MDRQVEKKEPATKAVSGEAHDLMEVPMNFMNSSFPDEPCQGAGFPVFASELAPEVSEPDDAYGEIVGTSPALRHVLRLVETVAGFDSTALLLGETGTGKELVARAIHKRSPRRDRPFLKMNCAAIPVGLLESELFGHERGAFTGAIAQKVGRLEFADRGTLFLDEIGDIPLELQPKLLRAIQDREFERLGCTRTKKVNVRIVAATHRDLEV
jgi:formate hydrogenlyase transcriptional activator